MAELLPCASHTPLSAASKDGCSSWGARCSCGLLYSQEDGAGQTTSFGLPPVDGGGVDSLAAEMAKLDREIAGPVIERPAWMQRPTPAEVAAAAANHSGTNTPSHLSQHSRTSSFGGAPPAVLCSINEYRVWLGRGPGALLKTLPLFSVGTQPYATTLDFHLTSRHTCRFHG